MGQPPNGISIGSARFCIANPYDQHTDRQTYRQTDRATCNICSNRPLPNRLAVITGRGRRGSGRKGLGIEKEGKGVGDWNG